MNFLVTTHRRNVEELALYDRGGPPVEERLALYDRWSEWAVAVLRFPARKGI